MQSFVRDFAQTESMLRFRLREFPVEFPQHERTRGETSWTITNLQNKLQATRIEVELMNPACLNSTWFPDFRIQTEPKIQVRHRWIPEPSRVQKYWRARNLLARLWVFVTIRTFNHHVLGRHVRRVRGRVFIYPPLLFLIQLRRWTGSCLVRDSHWADTGSYKGER